VLTIIYDKAERYQHESVDEGLILILQHKYDQCKRTTLASEKEHLVGYDVM
jgi:hypothetical protein